ncbi:MAG: hypothetical protein M5U26_16750 [Planctomycetota bacterium]|nr:hypothetical protein [Planctomycetota bacterium]
MAILKGITGLPPLKWGGLLAAAVVVHAAGLWLALPGAGEPAGELEPPRIPVALVFEAEAPAYVPGSAAFRGGAPPPAKVSAARTVPAWADREQDVPRASAAAERRPAMDLEFGTQAEPSRELAQGRLSGDGSGRATEGTWAGDAPLAASQGGGAGAPRPGASSAGGGAAAEGLPARAQLRLPGKPVYPRDCRAGHCKHGKPCEGVSVWRVAASEAGHPPAAVELLSGAGCANLDASVKRYLERSHMPSAGEFEVRIRFSIEE